MKALLLTLLVLCSTAHRAQAASPSIICNDENIEEAQALVYSNFIHTYTTKKYPFPYVYQASDEAFKVSVASDCRLHKSSKLIIANAAAACTERCKQISKDFFTGFRKASKEEKLVFECSETCQQSKDDLMQLSSTTK